MNSLNIWLTFSFFFTIISMKLAMPKADETKVNISRITAPLLFVFALMLRVILAGSHVGFGADIGCFTSWSDRMAEFGPAGFYSADFFSDYPPLYLYVLYPIGLIRKTFALTTYSPIHLVLLKSPAIFADLAVGYMIHRISTRLVGTRSSLLLTGIYLFQPVVILNSCLWGQIDSVFTLFLLAVCIFLERQNLLPAMVAFALGVLLKPQMMIFTPLLIVGFIHYVYRGSFSLQRLIKAFSYALLTTAMFLLLILPFGMDKVIAQYADTVASYPYASVNAYNFWTGMGMNWYPQKTPFLILTAQSWGTVFIVLATCFSIFLGLRLADLQQKYALTGSFLIITVFTYSVRMHERYLYTALPLLLLAFAGFCSRQRRSHTLRIAFPIMYTLLTCLHFYNCCHVLLYYDPQNYNPASPTLIIAGISMVIVSLLFYSILIKLKAGKKFEENHENAATWKKAAPLQIKNEAIRLTRTDLLLLGATVLLYSFFALRDLGSSIAPQTSFQMTKGKEITLQFSNDHKASSLYYFSGPEHDRPLVLRTLSDDHAEKKTVSAKLEQVFSWKEIKLDDECIQVSLTAKADKTNVFEFVFLDSQGNVTTPVNAADFTELFDEQDTFPESISFRNSMYFDEIYHARTAYEYLHGLRSYENTHPPLGKILISIGVLIFGMNPFGWRIVGTVFGILMLPMLYLFAKRLTGDTACSALTCWIFAFDFMHFAQTRIATIDVYIVFFIICMYYFLFHFFTLDFGSVSLKHLLLPLGLCGISMGLGIACKWTGVYAGFGMGILFFAYLYILYQNKGTALAVQSSKNKHDSFSLTDFKKKTLKVILFCVIFFVIVPAMIYLLSYIPFRDNSGNSLIKQAINNQRTMFSYHSNLVATHYFASPFYEWPFIVRPIWYYSGVLSDTLREGISSFGNPLVWWAGIPALLYMFHLAIRKNDGRACFLIIGYLAQYLPWFFVERLTFIYHYFPSVVFMVLMIGYAFRNLKEMLPKKAYHILLITYAAFVFGLFLFFYPVLAGQPVELSFAVKYLKWFKTWILVAA